MEDSLAEVSLELALERILELEAELNKRPSNVVLTTREIDGASVNFGDWRNMPVRAGVKYHDVSMEIRGSVWRFLSVMFTETPTESVEAEVLVTATGTPIVVQCAGVERKSKPIEDSLAPWEKNDADYRPW